MATWHVLAAALALCAACKDATNDETLRQAAADPLRDADTGERDAGTGLARDASQPREASVHTDTPTRNVDASVFQTASDEPDAGPGTSDLDPTTDAGSDAARETGLKGPFAVMIASCATPIVHPRSSRRVRSRATSSVSPTAAVMVSKAKSRSATRAFKTATSAGPAFATAPSHAAVTDTSDRTNSATTGPTIRTLTRDGLWVRAAETAPFTTGLLRRTLTQGTETMPGRTRASSPSPSTAT